MDIKINVKNLDKVLSQLSRLNKELEKPFQEVVKGGGHIILVDHIEHVLQVKHQQVIQEI